MNKKTIYDIEYAKAHLTRKCIPFNDNTPEDVELLAWLSKQTNVTQYIKQLIREDMTAYNKNRSQNGCQRKTDSTETIEK